MIRMFEAELQKLTRRRLLLATGGVVLVAAIATTVLVFAMAEPAVTGGFSRAPTLEALAASGGGSEAFSLGVSFLGLFVLVLAVANWSGEFSHATFRTLLLAQPRRAVVLAGKQAALLAYITAALAIGFIVTWVASYIAAPVAGVSTDAWFSMDAARHAASAYASAVVGLGAWACFGMALGVLVRSTPIALGIGIVWAGPFEHITQDAWSAASGTYPGLLLESLAVGGTPDASIPRVLLLTSIYVALAVTVATLSFRRRDIVN
jgi:ABC-type transport system involved in multi-copper enzyme maturation permease subunit